MRRKGAITGVTADGNQLLNLIRSEAVAKFSSFRQLRFSTITNSSAVTCITSVRDASQQGFASPAYRASRCFLQQRGDAHRITRFAHVKSLMTCQFHSLRVAIPGRYGPLPVVMFIISPCGDSLQGAINEAGSSRYLTHIARDTSEDPGFPHPSFSLVWRLPLGNV